MGRIHYRKTQLGHIKITGIGGFHTLYELKIIEPSGLWVQRNHFFFDDRNKTLVYKNDILSFTIFLKAGKVFTPDEFNEIINNLKDADKRLKQIIQDAKDYKERKEYIITI